MLLLLLALYLYVVRWGGNMIMSDEYVKIYEEMVLKY
jgi:hypothetical protein